MFCLFVSDDVLLVRLGYYTEKQFFVEFCFSVLPVVESVHPVLQAVLLVPHLLHAVPEAPESLLQLVAGQNDLGGHRFAPPQAVSVGVAPVLAGAGAEQRSQIVDLLECLELPTGAVVPRLPSRGGQAFPPPPPPPARCPGRGCA